MEPVRSHDALFRLVFGEPLQCAELLQGLLPAAVTAAIDWPSLRRLDAAFVDVDLSTRHADLLFSARMGGAAAFVHVVVEHTSGSDRFTVLQLLRYRVRIWDRWRKDHPGEPTLPPVLTLVVHHGAVAWTAPRFLRDLVHVGAVSPEVAVFVHGQQPEAPYLLDDLAAQSEQQLADRQMSVVADLTLRFLQFLRTRTVEEAADDIARWQRSLRVLLDHHRGQEVMAALFSWLLAGVPRRNEALRTVLGRVDDPVTRQTMKSMLDDLLEQGFARGLEKGRQEGRQEGRTQALLHILTARFGALPDSTVARLRAADGAAIEAWTALALSANTLDAVFAAG